MGSSVLDAKMRVHTTASLSTWMSIFFIFIIAPITLLAFGPVICQGFEPMFRGFTRA